MRKKQTNASEYTVSEISGALRKTIEDTYGNVRVRGEISGYRGPHASGHAYFALKDDKARLDAVVWRGVFQRLKFPPEEGMEVIASGKLSSYPGSSRYQIIIDAIEPAGVGALMALLEERRKKLASEGIFDENRKKPLPFMPLTIGVITSPTGAVIRDIIHRVRDRFPVHIIVWPVRVQGETSGAEAAAAIRGFNTLSADNQGHKQHVHNIPRPDLLIVARGGGSLEDLWGFNDEDLVRAAAESSLPIISAIGHETDWTLLDYAADRRAPTPTGAAEIAVPVKTELTALVFDLSNRLLLAEKRFLQQNRQNFVALIRALPSLDKLLADPRRRLDESSARFSVALLRMIEFKRNSYQVLAQRFSPALFMRLTEQKRQNFAALIRSLPVGNKLLIEPRRQYKDQKTRFALAYKRLVEQKKNLFTALAPRLSTSLFLRIKTTKQQDFIHLVRRLNDNFIYNTNKHTQRLTLVGKLLENLSLDSILKRGFALITDETGNTINSVQNVAIKSRLELRLVDGKIDTTVNRIAPIGVKDFAATTNKIALKTSKNKAASHSDKKINKTPSNSKKKLGPPEQGNLF